MMKTKLAKTLALLCYIMVISLLFGLDWALLWQPIPFFSVILGMLLLTACQYGKNMTKADILAALRWNLILAAFLTTLISFFASSDLRLEDIGSLTISRHLFPLLYASIVYLILGILHGESLGAKPGNEQLHFVNLTATETAEKVFRTFSLTKREYHVAQKLLSDLSNKEIAAELYISEATVKKHIQNIYQKSGASDRSSFRDLYFEKAKNIG